MGDLHESSYLCKLFSYLSKKLTKVQEENTVTKLNDLLL